MFHLEKYIRSFFSLEGVWQKYQLAAVLSFVYICQSLFSILELPILNYIIELFLFYGIIVAIQKRCRDFHSNGTIWVVLYSLFYILKLSIYFITDKGNDLVLQVIGKLSTGWCIVIIALLFIPSKPKPNANLRSPLLKSPLLYVFICWVLAISATFVINHYSRIGV